MRAVGPVHHRVNAVADRAPAEGRQVMDVDDHLLSPAGASAVATQLWLPPAQGRGKAARQEALRVAAQLWLPPAQGRGKAARQEALRVAAQLWLPPAQGRGKAERATRWLLLSCGRPRHARQSEPTGEAISALELPSCFA
jgi:hypothetical protein